eukprot:30996-Pelagococcus_subviridis.AAC.7
MNSTPTFARMERPKVFANDQGGGGGDDALRVPGLHEAAPERGEEGHAIEKKKRGKGRRAGGRRQVGDWRRRAAGAYGVVVHERDALLCIVTFMSTLRVATTAQHDARVWTGRRCCYSLYFRYQPTRINRATAARD